MPAGLTDAALSSLATFVMGVYAARALDAEALGIFALFFSAFLLVSVVPAQLVLLPAEVIAVSRPMAERLGLLRRSLTVGIPVAVVAAVGVLIAIPVAPSDAVPGVLGPLAITSLAAAVLSPLQDHVRRLLHIAGSSWAAAGVSGLQLTGVAGGVASLAALDVPAAWVPFGALTAANALSLALGLALALVARPHQGSEAPSLRRLLRAGRWLLLIGLLPVAAGFVSNSLVVRLTDASTLGHAEAARIVAQPLLVLSVGLTAVLGPRSMQAAVTNDEPSARRLRRLFLLLVLGGGMAYALLVGYSWPGNLAERLIPSAYVVPGLVVAALAANVAVGLAFPQRYELLGGGRERALAGTEAIASAGQCLAAVTAGMTDAFAKPLGVAILGLVRLLGFQRSVRPLYSPTAPPVETPSTKPG